MIVNQSIQAPHSHYNLCKIILKEIEIPRIKKTELRLNLFYLVLTYTIYILERRFFNYPTIKGGFTAHHLPAYSQLINQILLVYTN